MSLSKRAQNAMKKVNAYNYPAIMSSTAKLQYLRAKGLLKNMGKKTEKEVLKYLKSS